MKKILLSLSLLLIISLTIHAQVLGVDRSVINVGPEAFKEKFDLCSDTTWTVVSSQEWLGVMVHLWYGARKQISMAYSGTAPDIGAFEFLQSNAAGRDSAFVLLLAEKNTATTRTATVTITGTNVPVVRTILVTQTGTGTTDKVIISNDRWIIKGTTTIINR